MAKHFQIALPCCAFEWLAVKEQSLPPPPIQQQCYNQGGMCLTIFLITNNGQIHRWCLHSSAWLNSYWQFMFSCGVLFYYSISLYCTCTYLGIYPIESSGIFLGITCVELDCKSAHRLFHISVSALLFRDAMLLLEINETLKTFFLNPWLDHPSPPQVRFFFVMNLFPFRTKCSIDLDP